MSWEDATDLLADPFALADAVAGKPWAAWLLDVAEWSEETGLNPADYDSMDEFLDVAEAELSAIEAEEYWDEGDEIELTADSDRYKKED